MKFHGRLEPGIVSGADPLLGLVIHAPGKASGVTIKIWELETFVSAQGKDKRDGAQLLAELRGDLDLDGQPTAPRRFTVKSSRIAVDDPEGQHPSIRLAVGGDQTYTLPLASTKGEAESTTHEIGFSIEQGGAEVFRSKAPCLYHPKPIFPTVVARAYDQFVDEEHRDEQILRLHHAVVGFAEGDGPKARLNVLGTGFVDLYGHLVDAEPTDDQPAPQPLPLSRDRELYVYVHKDKIELEADKGPSWIPIALCDPIEPDGSVRHRRLVEHPWGFQVLERKASRDGNGLAIADAEQIGDIPELPDEEIGRAFDKLAALMRGRGDR